MSSGNWGANIQKACVKASKASEGYFHKEEDSKKEKKSDEGATEAPEAPLQIEYKFPHNVQV